MLLEIRNLHASVAGNEILKGVDMKVDYGEVHAIMLLWAGVVTAGRMERVVHRLLFTFVVALALPAQAARSVTADERSDDEIARALKEALSVSSEGAIRTLGREGGFMIASASNSRSPQTLMR